MTGRKNAVQQNDAPLLAQQGISGDKSGGEQLFRLHNITGLTVVNLVEGVQRV